MSYVSDIKNKVALVTGGGSGIGKATAISLAEQGAKVFISGRTKEKLIETQEEASPDKNSKAKENGGSITYIIADTSKEEDVKRIYNEVGHYLHYLVVNAGVNGVWAPIEEMTVEEFDETVSINLRGTFLTIKHAVPLLKSVDGGASIVVISSINGNRTFSNTGATAYSATKAAQVAMTKMLAVELANYKIRVNVVCPGAIDTSIEEHTERRNTESVKHPVDYPRGQIPLTKTEPGSSRQVSKAIEFFLSSQSDHVTGTELYIDGAQSLVV